MGSARLARSVRLFLQRIAAPVQESSNLVVLNHDGINAVNANVARLMSTAIECHCKVGLRGIAVPLTGRGGTVVGALGMSRAASSSPIREFVWRCVPPPRATASEMPELV